MIVSASYRTDIPAFHAAWFQKQFAAGYCLVANPYGGAPARVPLRNGVDGYVFWTRNAAPFLDAFDLVGRAGLPFVVQYTVTGYPRALERAVPPAESAVTLIRRLADTYGPRAVVWRYDPILISTLTPPSWHLETFATLAQRLAGATDEVVTSFVAPYAKTARNLKKAAEASRFSWRLPEEEEKAGLIASLKAIAATEGLRLTLCTQPQLAGAAEPAACIDAQRLSDVAGHPIPARRKGNRPGCLCCESRDIGVYDSCSQGCVYCYAVSSQANAKQKLATMRRISNPAVDDADSPEPSLFP